MMQFPMALEKCGLSTDMQTMLTDAIESLKDVKVKLTIPIGQHATPNTADIMAKAVEDWTNWNFESFGYQMGKMLREIIMLAFPQKYSVDASGRLRKYSQAAVMKRKSSVVSASVAIIGGVVAASLLALAAIRGFAARRSRPLPLADEEPLTSDLEDGENHVIE